MGLAAATMFLGFQAEGRRGLFGLNRVHVASAFILFLVIVAFSTVQRPLLGDLNRSSIGIEPRVLAAITLAGLGAFVSLIVVRLDHAVARVRLGRDEEAARAARNVMLHGVMILALVLTLGALARDANQQVLARETTLAKWHATVSSFEAADDAIQIHGAYGYSDEYPVERYLRNARGAIIYEGTRELQELLQADFALDVRGNPPLRCELPAYDEVRWNA